MEQSLRKLGVEKLSKEDVQKMQWEALELKIGSWIQYMRISVGSCDICCGFLRTVNFCSDLLFLWWSRVSVDKYNQHESAADCGAY